MGNDIIRQVLPGLPLIIVRRLAILSVIALLSIELISIFC